MLTIIIISLLNAKTRRSFFIPLARNPPSLDKNIICEWINHSTHQQTLSLAPDSSWSQSPKWNVSGRKSNFPGVIKRIGRLSNHRIYDIDGIWRGGSQRRRNVVKVMRKVLRYIIRKEMKILTKMEGGSSSQRNMKW